MTVGILVDIRAFVFCLWTIVVGLILINEIINCKIFEGRGEFQIPTPPPPSTMHVTVDDARKI